MTDTEFLVPNENQNRQVTKKKFGRVLRHTLLGLFLFAAGICTLVYNEVR